jgi:phosphoribosylamine---glycine ligase
VKVLVIGGGGREHAMAWKLAQGSEVEAVYVAPGNPGMALDAKVHCTGIAASDFAAISDFCRKEGVGFVAVGPDQALADGAVDYLEAKGIPAFGPTREAARIEWSKAYSKGLMREARIPTARYELFESLAPAQDFLRTVNWGDGWVIKADGLALGKGVVVCETREEALATVEDFLSGGAMGEAGRTIVVEERLIGREVSAFFLCDGERGVPLGMACDYKRIGDGDQGPNTGGMGAFSPADWLPEGFLDQVGREVTAPLLKTLQAKGVPFKGVLFIGLMVTKQGPKVLEFNARFGDPETQVLLPLLSDELLPWLQASRDGRLASLPAQGPGRHGLHGVHVVMAAHGYPGTGGQTVRKGDPIEISKELLPAAGAWEKGRLKLFFAGVAGKNGAFVTNGGRVLGLTVLAPTRAEARQKAYELLPLVKFSGAQWRRDVGC